MLFLKYLLITAGFALLSLAAAMLIHDLLRFFRQRQEGQEGDEGPAPLAWRTPVRLFVPGFLAILASLGIVVVPAGHAGIRVSQSSGVLPGTLYPGVHFVTPLIERVELYNVRDLVHSTAASDDPKHKLEPLRVQTREGLMVGLAVTVRYRLDPRRLHSICASLPHPVEQELVPPVVASAFREIAPNYMVRELFATKREEVRAAATAAITRKLSADGLLVKEVLLRDILLPAEYAKGLEGLLLKEQENERMVVELEVKAKNVRAAELEAEAEKARRIKEAEAQAQVTVLAAKAQADSMQHTLPLKEKQIQQTRLEAEARKESLVKNAEAQAQAKVIDGKAELERQKLMADAEDHRIRRVAGAKAEQLKLEAGVLKDNPLLIQKIVAEKLSDKVQIMMVPSDGKFFFANDVLRGPVASGVSAALPVRPDQQ